MDKIIKLIAPEEVNAEVRIRTYTGNSKIKKFFLGSMAPENVLKEFIDVLEHTQLRFNLRKYVNYYNEERCTVRSCYVYPECSKEVKELIDDFFEGPRCPFGGTTWKKCYQEALNNYKVISCVVFPFKGEEYYDTWKEWSSKKFGTSITLRIFFKETKEEIVKKTYLFDDIIDETED
jgi:hypothetical protein